MAASVQNPMFDAQPFEENQGTTTRASQYELEAFYEDMKRKDVERKLSKRSTGSKWSRKKSVRKNSAANPPAKDDMDAKSMAGRSINSGSNPPPTIRSTSTVASKREIERVLDKFDENDTVSPMVSRSLVPATLPKLSTELSVEKEDWNSPVLFRVKYPIHNPVGPRFYRNVHLARPSVRPSSFFSPAFPPMSYAHEASKDSTRIAGPSRASSASPLPTPNSSQTGIVEPVGPAGKRSRKNSQTDNVDLLDVTDPWGQNWHHTSPYDLGYSNSNSPTSPEPPEDGTPPPRPRRQSTITPQKPRIAPSPLSQSTSAIHLQAADPAHVKSSSGFRVLRKLSKRRNPVDNATFTPPGAGLLEQRTDSRSAVASPHGVDTQTRSGPMQSASTLNLSTTRKEKRGSVLGRLVKKFSILKRSSTQVQPTTEVWHHVDPPDPSIGRPSYTKDEPEPEEVNPSDPQILTTELSEEPARVVQEHSSVHMERDRKSSISVELPYATGQLTIANPDAPSVQNTPAPREARLPSLASFSGDLGPPHPVEPLFIVPEQDKTSIHSSVRVSSPRPPSAILVTSPPTSAREAEPAPPVPRKNPARTSRQQDDETPRASRALEPPSRRSLQESEARSSRHSVSTSMIASPAMTHSTVMESPLSVSSLIVNPPTPHAPTGTVAPTPGPPVPSKLPESSAPSIKMVDARSRGTETYKLVRSKSGNIYHMNETIPGGGGQHWEIQRAAQTSLEKNQSHVRDSSSAQGSRPGRERESEYDHQHRNGGVRDKYSQRREEREKEREKNPSLHKERREGKERGSESGSPRDQRSSRASREVLRKPPPPVKDNAADRPKSDKRPPEKRTSQQIIDHSQSSSGGSHQTPQSSVQRRPSKGTRPVSELPSAADLNSTKAKEAYEIERIWKARSMNGLEPHAIVFPAFPSGTTEIRYEQPSSSKSVHGSSHTSYTVQTPFQNQPPGSHIYHSMPTSPPPIVYSSSPPGSSANMNNPLNGYPPSSQRDSQMTITPSYSPPEIPPSSPFPSLSSNPLPPPPKESPYKPKPIPGHDSSSPGLGQWTAYTGLTTAH